MQRLHGEVSASSRGDRPRRGREQRLLALLLVGLAGCALPPAVTADDPPLASAAEELRGPRALSDAQHQALRQGGRVEQLVELERQGKKYVGGVSYVLVRAEPQQVFDVLNRLETLADVLPQTRNLRIIERSGGRVRVEIEQGNSVVSTAFGVFFELAPPEGGDEAHMVRFWLDPSQPHGIDDVWGFFRATRYDAERSLVSVGALVDLGPGLIRMLFEQRVVRAILRMPNRIRDVVERTPGAGASAWASEPPQLPGSVPAQQRPASGGPAPAETPRELVAAPPQL
jgi:hypothetical protein